MFVFFSGSSEKVYNGNGAVHTGSVFSFNSPSDNGNSVSNGHSLNNHGDGLLNDEGVKNDVVDDTIDFPVGWSPLKYE